MGSVVKVSYDVAADGRTRSEFAVQPGARASALTVLALLAALAAGVGVLAGPGRNAAPGRVVSRMTSRSPSSPTSCCAVLLERHRSTPRCMGIPGYDTLLPDYASRPRSGRSSACSDLLSRLDALQRDESADDALEVEIVRDFAAGALTALSARTDRAGRDRLPRRTGRRPAARSCRRSSSAPRTRRWPTSTGCARFPGSWRALAERLTAGTAAGRTAVAHLTERNIAQVDRYLGDPEQRPAAAAHPAG